MYLFRLFFDYIAFWFRANDAHGLHSPFVFELYTEVIEPEKKYYAFFDIALLRKKLLDNQNQIEIRDLGAGKQHSRRKISEIARKSAISPQKGELLFKLVDFFRPQNIIELGTSLGLGTLYLSEASAKADLYTFEACPNLIGLARKHLENAYAKIHFLEGNIDETLEANLLKINRIDFVFFDANHRSEPTWRYFEQCLAHCHEETVFVFDDIRWSADMQSVWQKIIADERVSISLDLFSVGIVFFKKGIPKQHFNLRF